MLLLGSLSGELASVVDAFAVVLDNAIGEAEADARAEEKASSSSTQSLSIGGLLDGTNAFSDLRELFRDFTLGGEAAALPLRLLDGRMVSRLFECLRCGCPVEDVAVDLLRCRLPTVGLAVVGVRGCDA